MPFREFRDHKKNESFIVRNKSKQVKNGMPPPLFPDASGQAYGALPQYDVTATIDPPVRRDMWLLHTYDFRYQAPGAFDPPRRQPYAPPGGVDALCPPCAYSAYGELTCPIECDVSAPAYRNW
jgi:hypothetical protein